MTAIDGRMRRGTRNREAIVNALLGCYEAGDLRPTVSDVAARAGVSARSVHNHFEDVEALRAEVAQRQWERYAPLLAQVIDVEELLTNRIEFFEAVSPVRRAALLSLHDSPTIARNLARLDRLLRRQLEKLFVGMDQDILDALDLALSWDAWNRLRNAQGCSIARARRVLERTIHQLTEGSAS